MAINTLIVLLLREKEIYNKKNYNKMWTVREEIETALKTLDLPQSKLRQLSNYAAKQIIDEAKNKYVTGNPRVWWLGLKLPFKDYDYDFPSDNLTQHISNQDAACYWIPETEEEELPVFETWVSVISEIMNITSSFEYYVLGKDITWLLIGTDHSQLIVIK